MCHPCDPDGKDSGAPLPEYCNGPPGAMLRLGLEPLAKWWDVGWTLVNLELEAAWRLATLATSPFGLCWLKKTTMKPVRHEWTKHSEQTGAPPTGSRKVCYVVFLWCCDYAYCSYSCAQNSWLDHMESQFIIALMDWSKGTSTISETMFFFIKLVGVLTWNISLRPIHWWDEVDETWSNPTDF